MDAILKSVPLMTTITSVPVSEGIPLITPTTTTSIPEYKDPCKDIKYFAFDFKNLINPIYLTKTAGKFSIKYMHRFIKLSVALVSIFSCLMILFIFWGSYLVANYAISGINYIIDGLNFVIAPVANALLIGVNGLIKGLNYMVLAYNEVGKFFDTLESTLKDLFTTKLNSLIKKITDLFDEMVNKIVEPFKRLKEQAERTINQIKDGIYKTFGVRI